MNRFLPQAATGNLEESFRDLVIAVNIIVKKPIAIAVINPFVGVNMASVSLNESSFETIYRDVRLIHLEMN